MRTRPSFARWVLDSGAVVVFQRRRDLIRRDLAVVLRILPSHPDPAMTGLLNDTFIFTGHLDYILVRWTDRRGEPRVLLQPVRDSTSEAAVALRRDLVAGMSAG